MNDSRLSPLDRRLLAIALRLMPRDLRDTHGADLLDGFARDRRRPPFSGVPGAIRFWTMVAGDIARVRREARADGYAADGAARAATRSGRADAIRIRWREVRDAVRGVRRAPGFSTAAIVILALGTALSAGMFTVLERLLLAPLPVAQPHALVSIGTQARGWPETWGLSPVVFDALERDAAAFSSLGYFVPQRLDSPAVLRGPGGAERLRALGVSPNFFDVLGVAPALGRPFAHRGTTDPVDEVMLGHAAWRDRYGADPSVIGSSLEINHRSRVVAGVLPPGFTVPFDIEPVDYWIARALPSQDRDWDGMMLWTIARLAPGATLSAAASETQALAARAAGRLSDPDRLHDRMVLLPLEDALESGWRRPLALLSGAAFVVLLIAGSSFSLLVLARHASRQHEFAVRLALGADRASIARRVGLEVFALACLGTACGLLLAAWMYPAVLRLAPGVLPHLPATVRVDTRLFVFAAGAAALLAALGAAFPLAHLRRWRPEVALRAQGRGAQAATGAGLASFVVAAQCAAMALLVVVLGMTVTSLWRLHAVDPGFRANNRFVLAVTIPSPPGLERRAALARERARLAEMTDLLEAMPGIARAGAVSHPPLTDGWGGALHIEKRPWPAGQDAPAVDWEVAAPGYFEAAGIEIVAGREFEPGDTADAPFVAVVSEELVRRLLPGPEVIGLSISGESESGPWRRIVGVVRDVRQQGLDAERRPHMYIAQAQSYGFSDFYLVFSTRPGAAVPAADIRARLRGLDAGMVIGEPRPMRTLVAASTARERLATTMVAIFAGLAVALGVAGTWGVVSFSARSRRHELAVRSALGASRGALVRAAARAGLAPAAAGLLIGFALAVAAARLLASELYGLQPWEPLPLAGAAIVLLAASGTALLTPARRLSRVDPVSVLRGEG